MDFLYLLKLKWNILRNKAFSLRKESNLKIAVITLFILGYGIGAFWVFLYGFDYIAHTMGMGYFVMDRLFYVFFMVLLFMLIVSQLIITYTTFYRNPEIEFFFSLPVSYSSVFGIKFLESTFLSSWAFVFLFAPLLLAYGVGRSLGIGFYLVGLALSVPFIFTAAGLGTIIGVVLIRFFPKRFLKIIGICGLVIGIVAFAYYHQARQEINWRSGDIGLIMDALLRHTNISMFPGLPSYWISSGLMNNISGAVPETVFYFLVLLSTGIFIVWLCLQLGKRLYYSGWQMLKSKHYTHIYIPGKRASVLNRWQVGALAWRDLKLFFRDPSQWSQFAIFFGVIAVYILNLRQMNYDIESIFWKNLISYLNLGTIALTLGMLSTRFIFPQWSMECKRMWIIGLTPVSIGKLLITKLLVSAGLCMFITMALMIGSNIMLRVPAYMMWLSLGTMFIMGITLPALALGLGAIFPNTKEDNMAHIVASFGGTLTLVLSLTYIITILALEVMPVHLYFTKQMISRAVFCKWMTITMVVVVGISVLTIVVPLLVGWRKLLRAEY